jgi:hypothetical protein
MQQKMLAGTWQKETKAGLKIEKKSSQKTAAS